MVAASSGCDRRTTTSSPAKGSTAARAGGAPASHFDAAPAAEARTWPAGAPSPTAACNRHEDCAIIRWDGPWPPDPCCDRRVPFTPVTRAYLAFFDTYRAAHCAGVKCPTAPLPGAEPGCCVVIPRCVNHRCVQGCDDPTLKAPAVSSLDPACQSAAIAP